MNTKHFIRIFFCMILCGSVFAQEKEKTLALYINAFATSKTNHQLLLGTWLKDRYIPVERLIKIATQQEDSITNLYAASVLFPNVPDPNAATELAGMLDKTQKALLSLKIIQTHEQRKNKKANYQWG